MITVVEDERRCREVAYHNDLVDVLHSKVGEVVFVAGKLTCKLLNSVFRDQGALVGPNKNMKKMIRLCSRSPRGGLVVNN